MTDKIWGYEIRYISGTRNHLHPKFIKMVDRGTQICWEFIYLNFKSDKKFRSFKNVIILI
jgi:hypothetical protein